MTADARMRLESVSKIWTAALILFLDQDRVLEGEDTVEQWLPGLFPDGDRITILLTNSGGLIDDNDVYRSEAAFAGYLANMQHPHLRSRITATAAPWPPTRHSRCRRRCWSNSPRGSRCCSRRALSSVTRTSASTSPA